MTIKQQCEATKESTCFLPKAKDQGSWSLTLSTSDAATYLALTDEEFRRGRVMNPGIRQHACQFLEYGECREGYWTSKKFMRQIDVALGIAEVPQGGVTTGYLARAAATRRWSTTRSRINVNPGGKQPL